MGFKQQVVVLFSHKLASVVRPPTSGPDYLSTAPLRLSLSLSLSLFFFFSRDSRLERSFPYGKLTSRLFTDVMSGSKQMKKERRKRERERERRERAANQQAAINNEQRCLSE